MRSIIKLIIASATGLAAFGLTAAYAGQKPDRCADDHDHRSHAANYYDYYDHDRYYRSGPYKRSGLSISIRLGDGHYDDYSHGRYRDRDRYYRADYGRRNGYRGRNGRIVNKQIYNTRHRARIVLIEEVVRTRRGPRLLCTVEARGREAEYVSKRRMHRIANRDCSRRARIRVYA